MKLNVAFMAGLVVLVAFVPFPPVAAATLWEVLKADGDAIDIMGLSAADDGFILYGSKFVQIALDDSSDKPMTAIVPAFKRRQLFLLKADNSGEVLWRHTYPVLPEAYEILSAAVTNNGNLHVVYTDHVEQGRLINPLLAQVNPAGQKSWSIRIFDRNTSSEQIANLDAINLVATPDNNCLLLFITRSITGSGEQYRLRTHIYDPNGKQLTNKYVPTHLYGALFLVDNKGAGLYSVITSNLSRDAALEAMLLKIPFTPEYNLLSINTQGNLLNKVEDIPALQNAWLNTVISWNNDSLILSRKHTSGWLEQLDSHGKHLQSYENMQAENTRHNNGGEFSAAAQTLADELIVADREKVYLFNKSLKLKSTYNIKDITTHSYINSKLKNKLQDEEKVRQILPMDNRRYLLFFQYGSRIVMIKTH